MMLTPPRERPSPDRIAAAVAQLQHALPGRCTTGAAIREQHAGSLTGLAPELPDVVVFPATIAEVQAIVAVAREHRLPIIPFGAGTSLEGHVNAPLGGISVDLSHMARILRIGEDDLDATVEPGVTLAQLNTALRATGLFFPVDPGAANATLGGMASTRASGTTTVRYGAMPENVLAMKVVLADGRLVSLGSRARKSAAGYDLVRLFIGAEGTLGIIVELTLRLQPRPETVLAGVATFPAIAAAARTTMAGIQAGLSLQRAELLDRAMLEIVNAASGAAWPAAEAALFVEIAGTPAAAAEHLKLFTALAESEQGHWEGHGATEKERQSMWKVRHDAFWSIRAAYPGRSFLVTDVCVPLSRLAECLDETVADLRASGLTAPIVGHVGDGNFHTILVYDADDAAEPSRVTVFLDRLAARALRLQGTCTGEHGIGQGKVKYLVAEAGAALDLMRQVKSVLDPLNLMNPAKFV